MMALNTETINDDGSECWNWEVMMGLNTETEKRWWVWTPKLRSDGGSERRNWEVMMIALNTEIVNDDGFERRN